MKNLYFFASIIVLLGLISLENSANAQTVNGTSTIFWLFNSGSVGQTATYSDTTANLFKNDFVAVASNNFYKDSRTTSNVTYTRFEPVSKKGSADNSCLISYRIWPKRGLSFTPTSIVLNTMRFGTGGGLIDVYWKSSNGTLTNLATGIKPIRDNEAAIDSIASSLAYNLVSLSVPASDSICSLDIYLYALDPGKQVGFANIEIKGDISGTMINIPEYRLKTTVSPIGAGTITTNPVGELFDSNSVVTLTANKEFGYGFSHWENESGTTVSSDNPYTLTLTDSVDLTAVYNAINTYELSVSLFGGANDYMVTLFPEGTLVGDKLMYEEGTKLTLSAHENQLLTFTNWGTGETSSDLVVSMTTDKNINAYYSAVDFMAAWDFYLIGNNGRLADFYSGPENETSTLILRDTAGTIVSWLDKSIVAANGYEGEGAAVNWNNLADKYYYQISFDATNYTNINVSSSMLFNYNAYSIQKCEYSLDGTIWETIGNITMSSAKVWYDNTIAIPAVANNASKVYFRWIPDYTSNILGTSTNNDGTSIAQIYVTGTKAIVDDGVAPVLSSSVPAASATGVSASGKIVLIFDENVQLSDGTNGTIGALELTPKITGKTITFNYNGLNYNTPYSFALAANTVSDLSGNTLTSAITIDFTTMNRPKVSKKLFDFVVDVDGSFADAIVAADAAAGSGERFYVFFPNGEYHIGGLTGDGNEMSTIAIPNVSYIGQNPENVYLYNLPTIEGIGVTATVYFTNTSSNIYMQDISLQNRYDYAGTTGRAVALWDQGDRNIYKNVKLLSYQDTYYSGSERNYFETSEIHGVVDFICGGGDVFFNECLVYIENKSGAYITAPATASDWGYVFSGCTIDGHPTANGTYNLGRPWSNAPKAVYINTSMKVIPTAGAWGDPMNVVPSIFAEYNSLTSNGATVDLSNRRTTYTKDATTVTLNPVLTEEGAATYTIENVLGGSDAWQPRLYTEQSAAPVILPNTDSTSLTWNDSEYVLCWGIFKNDTLVEFTISNSYAIPGIVESGIYTVRAANEMGGLSEISNKFYLNIKEFYMTEEVEICNGENYTFPDGTTQENITSQVVYSSILKTVNGYDSTITTTVDVKYMDTSVSVNGVVLTANLAGASYEWVSCANENVSLGTEQSFTATESGQYAVKITYDGCTSLSECKTITVSGINEVIENSIVLYPNPTTGKITLDSKLNLTNSRVVIRSITGKVMNELILSPEMELSMDNYESGIYFISIRNNYQTYDFKVIKK